MANRIKGITVEIGGKRQFKQAYNRDRPIVLYYKHTADTKWYQNIGTPINVECRGGAILITRSDMIWGKAK